MHEPISTSAAHSAPGKKFDPARKRFHSERHVPVIVLGGDGTIEHMSPAARRLLEYGHGSNVTPCFFSHVHARNMYQVMRDVADMVCYGKPRANWLVRLRTGRGRWQWFRASVSNELNASDKAIRVVLNDL